MNTATETLAERLQKLEICFPGPSGGAARKSMEESASRLLAQQATMTKQDERIAELEKELAEMSENYRDASNASHSWKLKAERYWQELEEWKDKFDASELTHAATRADLRDATKQLVEAQGDAESWKREAMIADARLRGEKHPDDNGIVSPGEIIPRLQAKLQAERALADRLAHWMSALDVEEVIPADWQQSVQNTLAAWKEARRE